ncbi:mdj1 protein precursor [Coemansia erecta]|uniref:Mdj1 protein n=1 Tax=Coemansia erecta TaxID=147472 RepID=A0A9W7Y3D9_9FUNG|nr:mdj1 protein precursor [Coemansia erecta]
MSHAAARLARLAYFTTCMRHPHPTKLPAKQAAHRLYSRHTSSEADRIVLRLGTKDAYKTLGVDKHSTAAEIKTKYYELCRELHPDTISRATAIEAPAPASLGISNTQWYRMSLDEKRNLLRDHFVAVRDAYEVFSDAGLRKRYDMYRGRSTGLGNGERSAGPQDVWAKERPTVSRRWKTDEEKRDEKRIGIGILGFASVLAIVMGYQKLVQSEDLQRISGIEHFRSVKVLARARERAMEKWREVPPEQAMLFETRRLRSAQNSRHGGRSPEEMALRAGEYHKLWPDGAGLGLIALLDDSQLCGVESRKRVATDPELPAMRSAAQRALERDRIVRRYYMTSTPKEQ